MVLLELTVKTLTILDADVEDRDGDQEVGVGADDGRRHDGVGGLAVVVDVVIVSLT